MSFFFLKFYMKGTFHGTLDALIEFVDGGLRSILKVGVAWSLDLVAVVILFSNAKKWRYVC